MIENSVGKFIGNFNYLMATFLECTYEIKYKLFKTFCMDLYGCVLWNLSSNCMNKMYTMWRKCIRQLLGVPYRTHSKFLHRVVNDIPIESQVHKRFLKFFESILNSCNPIVKFCGQLALSGSSSIVCKNVNYIWSKYNVCLPKSEKESYRTVSTLSHTFEKHKYGNYDTRDYLCINSIRELLDMRESKYFFSFSECNTLFEFFCTYLRTFKKLWRYVSFYFYYILSLL